MNRNRLPSGSTFNALFASYENLGSDQDFIT